MNDLLINFYINKPKEELKYYNVNYDIFDILNKNFSSWTYQVLSVDIGYINNNEKPITKITNILYIPGKIITSFGNGIDEIAALKDSLKNALMLAYSDKVNNLSVNSDTKTNTQTTNTETNNDKPIKNSKYSDELINRVKKFKEDFDIQNDEQFINYLKTWNSNIQSKKQLNPELLEQFLDWVYKIADNSLF